MDTITFTNMTDFKHSEMTVASQNDCKLTAYKFSNRKLLFSAEYLTNKILTQTQVKIVMEVTTVIPRLTSDPANEFFG